MAGKMSPKFVTLCSLAVGAIYSTGYSITNSHNTAAAAPAVQAHASAPATSSGAQTNGSKGSNSKSSSKTNSKATSGTSQSNKKSSSDDSSSQSSSSNQSSAQKSSTSNISSKTKTSKKTSSKKTNTTSQYLDGTYNGSASNRIGTVAVAVSIKSGKIANVQITQCDTHYPERYINPVLPNYVVAHQTTRIPIVSGATLSTRDFYFAVVQALSQAKNPNYKG